MTHLTSKKAWEHVIDHSDGDKHFGGSAMRGGAEKLTLDGGYVFHAFTKYFTVPEGAVADLSFEEAVALVELAGAPCAVMYWNADAALCIDSLRDVPFDDINAERIMAVFSVEDDLFRRGLETYWMEGHKEDVDSGEITINEPVDVYIYSYDHGETEDFRDPHAAIGRPFHALVPESKLDGFVADVLGAKEPNWVDCSPLEYDVDDYRFITNPVYY